MLKIWTALTKQTQDTHTVFKWVWWQFCKQVADRAAFVTAGRVRFLAISLASYSPTPRQRIPTKAKGNYWNLLSGQGPRARTIRTPSATRTRKLQKGTGEKKKKKEHKTNKQKTHASCFQLETRSKKKKRKKDILLLLADLIRWFNQVNWDQVITARKPFPYDWKLLESPSSLCLTAIKQEPVSRSCTNLTPLKF